jgi:hypothetical protein
MRSASLIVLGILTLPLGILAGLWSIVCFLGGPHPTSTGDALLFGCIFGIASLLLLTTAYAALKTAARRAKRPPAGGFPVIQRSDTLNKRVILLVIGFLICTSGCTCAYRVADREVLLERGLRTEEVESALRQVEAAEDLEFVPERNYHVFFVIPASDAPWFHFRTEGGVDRPFSGLRGKVTHRDGSARVELEAQTVNREPEDEDRRQAHNLFFKIERELRQSASNPTRDEPRP